MAQKISIDRAKFLLDNRGGPQNLLPTRPQFGVGYPHEKGVDFEEFQILAGIVFDINDRLEKVFRQMGREIVRIDLIGVLMIVTDRNDTIRWHSFYQDGLKTRLKSGEMPVSEIPDSVAIFAHSFFTEPGPIYN